VTFNRELSFGIFAPGNGTPDGRFSRFPHSLKTNVMTVTLNKPLSISHVLSTSGWIVFLSRSTLNNFRTRYHVIISISLTNLTVVKHRIFRDETVRTPKRSFKISYFAYSSRCMHTIYRFLFLAIIKLIQFTLSIFIFLISISVLSYRIPFCLANGRFTRTFHIRLLFILDRCLAPRLLYDLSCNYTKRSN
jgi:hypothetical protein